MVLLLLFFALAILASFLCSILEAVLLSITPSFISATEKKRPKAGKLMSRLKGDIDRPLSAILSLNTIAHTVGAAGVGAQAQAVFSNVPFSVISGILTLLILVFSEIIPKTLGATFWRPLAVPCSYLTQFLTIIFLPFVMLSSLISKWMTGKDSGGSSITRDEIHAVAQLGEKAGVLDGVDARMLESIIEFQHMKAVDIFTPRSVVKAIAANKSVKALWEEEKELPYSRYPVLEGSDKIVGYLLKSELLKAAANDQWDLTAGSMAQKAMIIPETMSVKKAMTLFLKGRIHMAMVVDEFGNFSGVLTLEDVVETLIGHEIMDEADLVEDLRGLALSRPANVPDKPSTGMKLG